MQTTSAPPTVVGGSSKSSTITTTKDSNIQSMETGGTVKLITVAVATNTLVTDKRNGNTANQDTTAEAMKQTTGQDWHEAVITVHGYRVMYCKCICNDVRIKVFNRSRADSSFIYYF